MAIDIESRDPQLTELGPGWRRDAYVVGVSFAIEDGPCAYLPMRHEAGGNLPVGHVLQYLKDQAAVFTGDLITANGQYDLDGLAEEGVVFKGVRFHRDVQIAEPLCDELQFTYSLEAITARRGLPGKDERMLEEAARALGLHPKKDLWRLHSKFVGAYGEQDARALHPLIRLQERQLEDEELWRVYDLECRLMPVLLKMRRRGVRIDHDALDRIERWSIEEETAALNELHRQTGCRLDLGDVNKKGALLPVLKDMKVEIPTTPTGQPSITKAFLLGLKGPIGGLINRARKFNKLRGTFVDGRRRHAIGDRIHCTLNQLRSEKPGADDDSGARYGRLSCADPNLQQEPARDPEIGPVWRTVYVPDEGGRWACLDFSQQEPRWAVHFAEMHEERMRKTRGDKFIPTGASIAGDRYRQDPTTDNHDMMATILNPDWPNIEDPDVKKRERSNAKNIFLGLCYGEGPKKLAKDLGLPTDWEEIPDWLKKQRAVQAGRSLGNIEIRVIDGVPCWEVAGPEAKAILDRFHERCPWLKGTADGGQAYAAKYGFVRTVLGRKCRFPKAGKNNWGNKYDWCHKAFNRVIQGSSGDQIKSAMVNADAAGIRLQLQVHDELDLTIWSEEEARECARIMKDAVPCRVPHRIDIEVGPNWAEIKKL